MKDFFNKNFKSLKKEIEKEARKCSQVCSQVGKIKIVK